MRLSSSRRATLIMARLTVARLTMGPTSSMRAVEVKLLWLLYYPGALRGQVRRGHARRATAAAARPHAGLCSGARTARALHAHCTRTACALRAHCMRTACALQRAGDADRRAAAVDGRASDAHGAPLAQAPDRARDQGQKGQRQAGVVVGKGGYRNRHLWHHRHRRRPRRVTVAAPGHKGHPLLGMCDMCTCFVAPRFLCAGNCRQPEPHV